VGVSIREAVSSSTGIAPWLPWIGLVVVAGIIGGGIGVSGLAGHETTTVVEVGAVGLERTVSGHACADGPAVGELIRGERVLALNRNVDSTWVSVRDPRNLYSVLWVPVGELAVDADQGAVSELPLGDPCPTISLPPIPGVEVPPATVPVAPGAPAPPPPAPAADTTAPSISAGSFSPQPVYGTDANQPSCPTESTVVVTATDNVAIASVTGSSSFAGSTVTLKSQSGNSYTFGFRANYNGAPTVATVTFTAVDSAGNSASAPKTLAVRSGNFTNCYLG
jgi:hypothetical protein